MASPRKITLGYVSDRYLRMGAPQCAAMSRRDIETDYGSGSGSKNYIPVMCASPKGLSPLCLSPKSHCSPRPAIFFGPGLNVVDRRPIMSNIGAPHRERFVENRAEYTGTTSTNASQAGVIYERQLNSNTRV